MATLSICICTRDRPIELARALASIAAGSAVPHAVLVSDDSRDEQATRDVCAVYPFVHYFPGAHRGLCANRNAVISHADTDYVSLIDDDAIVSKDFVSQLHAFIPQLDSRTIVTGDVLEYGGRSTPKNPSFWGHFVETPKDILKTINLNCNCFPRRAFDDAAFDESLIYGYEDMDLCAHLLKKKYKITYRSTLSNEHAPPPRTGDVNGYRYRYTQQARFRTSMMRYLVWERKLHLAVLYFFLAPVHRALHDLKNSHFEDLRRISPDIIAAAAHALRALSVSGVKPSQTTLPRTGGTY